MTRLGIVQMTSGIDPSDNADTMVRAIAKLALQGAEIVFTPEMSGLLDRDRARMMARIRSEEDDAVLAAVRRAARAHGVWVAIGSLAVAPSDAGKDDDGRLANRSFLIDAEGNIAARYDKIHLFDVDLGEGERWMESKAYRAGDRAVVADTPAGRLGLSICYDIRFPRLYDVLSEAGAELITIPAAFTRPTGTAHWHLLARARAVESTAFVVAAAQTGAHEDGRATYGHSLVIDPWGEILLDMGTAAGSALCDIDLTRIGDVRRRLPSRDHRTHIARL
ncbi:carbon-nitrogen hydrolase family protein [Pacificimonas sp. WHA3]|uniref:Carbon-nitrogen hydrolase family protein n=1 Tax=Pacificimonas pallii TaxID=2827236 RepID=A0ABS6SHL2_9SPHN|nr:carbon-nitrogen hydrolase family protein [Pacificimonas pallii]MBV7257826.1 carbon-nitrogen hydrolase family protein [Pacificimonas pallii]